MGNRDHLIPSVTVDRNGHAKTVYVAPSGSGPRSSSLSSAHPTLARFEEYSSTEDDNEEDEDTGFGPDWEGISDPESWVANEFSANDAQDWSYEGFDADDAYGWNHAGFNYSDAKEWLSAGFNEYTAKEWADAEFDADESKRWDDKGFAVSDASAWRTEGFDDPAIASEWSGESFDPSEATEWRDAGFTEASHASEWKSGNRGNRADLADLKLLSDRNTEAEDSPSWISLLEMVKRLDGGSDATLDSLVDVMDGVNPSAGHEYVNTFPYSQWSILASGGIEFDKVRAVEQACSRIDENQQDADGDDYEADEIGTLEEAVSWIGPAEGFNGHKKGLVLALIGDGKHRPSEVKLFLASTKRVAYSSNAEDVLRANEWATAASDAKAPLFRRTSLFDSFYEARGTINGMDEIVEEHGVQKVADAILSGMTSEPQLRNYLDHIPVVGISEGAL